MSNKTENTHQMFIDILSDLLAKVADGCGVTFETADILGGGFAVHFPQLKMIDGEIVSSVPQKVEEPHDNDVN